MQKAPQESKRYRLLSSISKLMDSKFTIPGTKVKFGLDPILSLIPAAGDIVTTGVSLMLVWQMHTYGASRKLVIKMLVNVFLDAVISSVPLLGSVFDIFFKANDRNVRLLKEHYEEGKHQGSGNGIIIAIMIGIIVVIGLCVYVAYKLAEYLFEALF